MKPGAPATERRGPWANREAAEPIAVGVLLVNESSENRTFQRWSDTFSEGRRRVQRMTGDLSPEQLNYRPGPKRWSILQCIDHLSVGMRVYLEPMERTIASADGQGEEPYGRGPLLGRLLVWALRKPGARFPAPPAFRPRSGPLDPAEVRSGFDLATDRMQAALESCEGLDLGRIRMGWPVFGLVKISLAQAFELQALHVERHLDQAERVLRSDGFPRREERVPHSYSR